MSAIMHATAFDLRSLFGQKFSSLPPPPGEVDSKAHEPSHHSSFLSQKVRLTIFCFR